jgi:hypothetical protein
VVLFAYLLALTLLVLDVAIVCVDPRVRLGGTPDARRAVNRAMRARRSGQPAIRSARGVHRSALYSGARRPAGMDLTGAIKRWRAYVLERRRSLPAGIGQIVRRRWRSMR